MEKIRIDGIEEREIAPGFAARFIHTEHMTVSFWNARKGDGHPEHSHHPEQVVILQEGKLELTVDGTVHLLEPGEVFVVPPDVPHSAKPLVDTKMLIVFYPLREDYRSG
jgi:quercetin dioxygenase-like cupin family protein